MAGLLGDFDIEGLLKDPLFRIGTALMAAGGPQSKPHSFGQDLNSALQSYQQQAEGDQERQLRDLQLKQGKRSLASQDENDALAKKFFDIFQKDQTPALTPPPVTAPGEAISSNIASGPRNILIPKSYDAVKSVYEQAQKDYPNLPAGLLPAMGETESTFDPGAINKKSGARGIQQFMPATASGLGIDPMDIKQAVPGAARYLMQLYAKHGDWDKALAAYGGGFVGGKITPNGQTYVDTVKGRQSKYGGLTQQAQQGRPADSYTPPTTFNAPQAQFSGSGMQQPNPLMGLPGGQSPTMLQDQPGAPPQGGQAAQMMAMNGNAGMQGFPAEGPGALSPPAPPPPPPSPFMVGGQGGDMTGLASGSPLSQPMPMVAPPPPPPPAQMPMPGQQAAGPVQGPPTAPPMPVSPQAQPAGPEQPPAAPDPYEGMMGRLSKLSPLEMAGWSAVLKKSSNVQLQGLGDFLGQVAQHKATQSTKPKHYSAPFNAGGRTFRMEDGGEIEDITDKLGGQREGNAGPPAIDIDKMSPDQRGGLDYATGIYRRTQKMPPLGRGGAGASYREAILENAQRQAKAEGKSVLDDMLSVYGLKANQVSLNQAQKLFDSVESFEKTMVKNFDLAIEKMPEGTADYQPFVNEWIQTGRTWVLGDPAVPEYTAILVTALDEYAKILSGSTGAAGATDSSRAQAGELLNNAFTKEMATRIINNSIKPEAKNRTDSLKGQVGEIKDRMGKELGMKAMPAAWQIDLLKKNPNATNRKFFDDKFGAGSAKGILGN